MIGNNLRGLWGNVLLEITGACPEDCLSKLAAMGVAFRNYHKQDELTARVEIPLYALSMAEKAAKRSQCSLEILEEWGIRPFFCRLGRRSLFLIWMGLLTALPFWLQEHIWFLEVQGNAVVSQDEILQELEACGVGFFTSQASVDPVVIRNEMLSRMPELGWLTVNFQGPVAEVVVRERLEQQKLTRAISPASITAKQDGIVTEVTALSGSPQVAPGDVVTKGQVLISGVDTLDRTVLLTRASGEVFARTWTTMEAILPDNRQDKAYTGREFTGVSLTFGKNTINFYKTSGISYRDYDKITGRKQLTLPGGYKLPLWVTVTRFRELEPVPAATDETAAEALLTTATHNQRMLSMNAGQILSSRLALTEEKGLWRCSGILECREEIGTVVEITD